MDDVCEDEFGDFSEVTGPVSFNINALNTLFEPSVYEENTQEPEEKGEWMNLWKTILEDSIFNETKKPTDFSLTRNLFYDALGVPSQPIKSHNDRSTKTVTPIANLDKIVEKISDLVKIPIEELKSKSDFELRQIIDILGISVKNLNVEFNELLEVNEKLEMEFEVQNRLISCLIQHAMK